MGETNFEKRENRNITRLARYAITPVLMAEEDLRYVEARRAGRIAPNVYKTPNLWFPPATAI